MPKYVVSFSYQSSGSYWNDSVHICCSFDEVKQKVDKALEKANGEVRNVKVYEITREVQTTIASIEVPQPARLEKRLAIV